MSHESAFQEQSALISYIARGMVTTTLELHQVSVRYRTEKGGLGFGLGFV